MRSPFVRAHATPDSLAQAQADSNLFRSRWLSVHFLSSVAPLQASLLLALLLPACLLLRILHLQFPWLLKSILGDLSDTTSQFSSCEQIEEKNFVGLHRHQNYLAMSKHHFGSIVVLETAAYFASTVEGPPSAPHPLQMKAGCLEVLRPVSCHCRWSPKQEHSNKIQRLTTDQKW